MKTAKFFIAIVFGVLGIIANAVIYQQKNRKKLLTVKLISDVIWAIHYYCLYAYSGAMVCVIGIIRESVFINSDKKWAKSKLWLCLFLLLNLITGILNWKSVWNVLPCIAGIISVISFWIGNPSKTRYLSFPISALFFTYNVVVKSYAGIANEIATFTSVIIGIIRFKRNATTKNQQTTN